MTEEERIAAEKAKELEDQKQKESQNTSVIDDPIKKKFMNMSDDEKFQLVTQLDRTARTAVKAANENDRRLQALERKEVDANKPTITERNDDLWKRPAENIAAIVDDLLDKKLAPFLSVVEPLGAERKLEKFQRELVQDSPELAGVFQQYGGLVEQALAQNKNFTVGDVEAVATNILGAIARNKLPALKSEKREEVKTKDDITPPHLRSSRSPGPLDDKEKVVPKTINDLTENERRLFKEQGWKSVDEYVAFRDAPKDDMSWLRDPKFGKPAGGAA